MLCLYSSFNVNEDENVVYTAAFANKYALNAMNVHTAPSKEDAKYVYLFAYSKSTIFEA